MAEAQDKGPGGRLAITLGLLVIVAFFGVFGVWAAMAPLSTAAIAPGEVIVESKRKTVQHLEGGIVAEILVKDGDRVAAGQVLVTLDQVQPRAALAVQQGRRLAARTLGARLIAERDGASKITFPADLMARIDVPEVRTLVNGQRRIFLVRRKALANQIAILRQRDAQVEEEIRGLKSQIKSEDDQIELVLEEMKGVQTLVDKGLMPRPRLLSLQRRAAEIRGGRGRGIASIARARQTIGETRLRVEELATNLINEAVRELREVQAELFDLSERVNAARDVLRRTRIIAPIAGTVVGQRIATIGGVIAPGEPLLDIVPSLDALVIEARVNPEDIDIVTTGLLAEVRFTAFSQRSLPPVAGKVVSVSADRLIDETTKGVYYLARVELTENISDKLKGATLHPGMQTEVMIVTGHRTALSYFFKPVTDSFNRAFREQ
ncbi:MAG: HlyD family type I secretion periplasmic adaptor subunit [Alphaproteobacteria bacterium]